MKLSNKPNNGNNFDNRHVTKETYFEDIESQVFLAPKTLKLLRKYSIKRIKEQQLEYFFYTNTLEKAQELAKEIERLNYSVDFDKIPGENGLYCISGMTIKMPMDESIVTKWSQKMCKLGYRFDCKFDGWGTLVDPD